MAFAFLTGNVQYPSSLTDLIADLQKQCRLADTRRTAYQDQAARYSPAAQHPIKFTHAGGKADLVAAVHVPEGFRSPADANRCGLGLSRCGRLFDMFGHRIPGTAGAAAALPLRTFIAASGTEKDSFRLYHGNYSLHFFLYYNKGSEFGQVFAK